jgi:hypothetical protein
VKKLSLDGVVLQNMRLGDAGIALCFFKESPALFKHLLESLSPISQSLSLSHLDLL